MIFDVCIQLIYQHVCFCVVRIAYIGTRIIEIIVDGGGLLLEGGLYI